MTLRVAVPDMVSPSYFPVIAAVELGMFASEGIPAEVELVYPVTETYARLRDGDVDLAAGSAHAPLYAFTDWQGCRLCCALSQNMYWFLVVRADLHVERGDLRGLHGLRLGAAPGPVDGLRQMFVAVGMDPDSDVRIGPVPGASGPSISFGVTAAEALARGDIDGFWANGMGAAVAVRNGTGTVVIDARRGEGPAGASDYTFAALVVTEERLRQRPDEAAAAVRAVVAAQEALRKDPQLAIPAAQRHFPDYERSLIPELVARDAPFYDPRIAAAKVDAMNAFARRLGILSASSVRYEQVVAAQLLPPE